MPAYKTNRGTWYCSFYYTDWNGERKKKKKEGFKTKTKALEFERQFLERSQGSPDMTFNTLFDLYLTDCKSRLKPTTCENKEFLVNHKILPYFSDIPINTIEPSMIRKWQNEIISSESNPKPSYLKSIHVQLSAIFNYAVRYYKLPSNPAKICGAMGANKSDPINFWTIDEFNHFIAFSDVSMYTVIYHILFWSGMRIGECLALTLNDFDFTRKTVSITKSYARYRQQDIILDPKTPKSKRTITIPQFLCDVIATYVDKLYGYNDDDRLFPIIKSTINKHIIKTAEKAELKRIRIHDLRHSHASLLIEQGFSPLLISERLGHENIQTTLQTYSHLYPNKHYEVAEKLDQIIGNYDNIEIVA